MVIKAFYFCDDKLFVLNQKLLPHRIKYEVCKNHTEVVRMIKDMIIRGAPVIGCVSAYGFYLGSIEKEFHSVPELKKHLLKVKEHLLSSRPTAVNLSWAVERMSKKTEDEISKVKGKNEVVITQIRKKLLAEAHRIYKEDIECNKKIGEFGSELLKKNSTVLTHCNTGTLATAGYGTALGIIRTAYKKGKLIRVFVDETRPYLQGARLTSWELAQEKIPYSLITDNMAGHFMAKGMVDAVIVGADRIAANGDTANKIGTYSLAVLAKFHKIPFYVAAPGSTIDVTKKDGSQIPIEERAANEVLFINGKPIAPKNTEALHPAFDITPSKLITAIITDRGVFNYPYNFTVVSKVL